MHHDPGYDHITQLRNRRDEVIAMGLTLENIFGIVLVGMPVFALTAALPGLLRIVLFLIACVIGYGATRRIGGLRLAHWLWLQGRALLTLLSVGRRVNREKITGRVRSTQGEPSWGRQRMGMALRRGSSEDRTPLRAGRERP
jgi:hypothetical protein